MTYTYYDDAAVLVLYNDDMRTKDIEQYLVAKVTAYNLPYEYVSKIQTTLEDAMGIAKSSGIWLRDLSKDLEDNYLNKTTIQQDYYTKTMTDMKVKSSTARTAMIETQFTTLLSLKKVFIRSYWEFASPAMRIVESS